MKGSWQRRRGSLFWRLAMAAGLLYLVTCGISWMTLQMAIQGPAQAVVDYRLLALARELRGYRATALITGQPPYGSGDFELIWQIAGDDEELFRSDLLFFEDYILPAPEDVSSAFTTLDLETPLGKLHTVVRRIEETGPMRTGTAAERPVTVTYWAAITEERREQIMKEHAAPFERATLHIMLVVAALLFVMLLLLGLMLRAPLMRLRRAASRFQAGQTARLEGSYPSEIGIVVASLNDALERSERMVERTRRYIGKIGHDLKHPLAIVKNALDRPEEHAMARRRLDAMAALLDRYTTLAAAVGPGAPAPAVALLPLLEEARDGIALLYRPTPLAIAIDCPSDLRLHMARQDVEAIVTNLLTNAAKHAASHVAIRVADGAQAVLEVADDGPGLDGDERERALAWGERLDNAPPGSGFGLAIVKDLVELYGGRIALDTADLGGLRVRLDLPRDA